MADVITRFRLETTQYDSKLRDASKDLAEYARRASLAGKDMDKFAKGNVDAARALGKIPVSATNAKDKVKELVGAYNDLVRAYDNLTKEQQQGDFGKAMAESMQTLKNRIAEAKREMQGLSMPKGGVQGDSSMKGMLQVFGGTMMTKGVEMGISAAKSMAAAMKDTVQRGVELSKSAEGIRLAFERINRPDLLDKLKEATHGTVSELELMKQAVKFKDFNLNIDEMGTLLAFAQQKAKDTGQSVDYMVDSIVTGLGRQSLMILDNLGLSAASIKEKMKETGDMTSAVAAIIKEQMSDVGAYVETASDRGAKSIADLEDATLHLGDSFRETFGYEGVDEMSNVMETRLIKDFTTLIQSVDVLKSALSSMGIEGNAVLNALADTAYALATGPLGVLMTLTSKAFRTYAVNDGTAGSGGHIIEGYKKSLDKASQSVVTLKNRLKELQEQRAKAIRDGDTELSKSLQKQINQTKADIRGLDPNALKTPRVKTNPKTVLTEEQLNNKNIEKLTQEYIKASDDRRKAIEAEIKKLQERNIEIHKLKDIALGKVAPDGSLNALNDQLKKLQDERGKLSDPIGIEIQDQAIQEVQEKIDRLNGKKVEVELVVDSRSAYEKLKDSLNIELAEQNMQVDTTTLQTLMKIAIQNGIEGLDPDFAALQEKMYEGMNIPDEKWKELVDQINAQLQTLNIKPIKIDFNTGNIVNSGKKAKESWQDAANAVQSVGGALEQLDDPSAKIAGMVGEAIANIALGFAQATASDSKLGVFGWIAAIAGGLGTMISTISAIHSATGYAQGGIVEGNTYSGDQIPIMANAGEVVLNRAQTAALAGELQGAREISLKAEIQGEKIVMAANRFLKRSGQGEIVTWR